MKRIALSVLLAASPAAAQQPPVGYIDVYGVRTLTAEQVRAAAGIAPGDSIRIGTRSSAQAHLLALPGVRDAQVAIVCCENGQSIVYLGVQEQGVASFVFAAPPAGQIQLPGNVVQDAAEFERVLQEAVLQGQAEEDDSSGHALMRYPPARVVQQRFINYAAGNVARLRDVLHNSADARQRAIAAQVIAYAYNKSAIVPDLVAAMRDPDEAVRNNAMRALAVMASYNEKHAESMLRIPYEPFIGMLSSPVWTDRNKAAFVLMSLAASRDPMMLHQLRSRAFPELAEMARWQTFGHAFPAALILGRIAGIPDGEIMAAFQKDREALIEAARGQP